MFLPVQMLHVRHQVKIQKDSSKALSLNLTLENRIFCFGQLPINCDALPYMGNSISGNSDYHKMCQQWVVTPHSAAIAWPHDKDTVRGM